MREVASATVPGLRRDSLHLPAGALPELRPAPLRLHEARTGEGEAGGRQGAHHPAHDDDQLLHPDGTSSSWNCSSANSPTFSRRSKAELRAIWSAPDTRKKLLQGLAEKGFGPDQLAEMQKIIDAEKSDLFDVLAHVAYALPVSRPDAAMDRATQPPLEAADQHRGGAMIACATRRHSATALSHPLTFMQTGR